MGKAFMFMLFMWIAVCIAGSVMSGKQEFVSTSLSAGINDSATTLYVKSTTGFPDSGVLQIENEHIAYSSKSSTTFDGSLVKPMVRGSDGTVAAGHVSGKRVNTVTGGMMNSAASYNIAVISDTAGALYFISLPVALFSLIGNFFILPIQFLGTDLQILSYLWMVLVIGMVFAIGVSIAGNRRI